MSENKLLNPTEANDFLYPYESVREEDYIPALDHHIKIADEKIKAYAESETPVTFKDIVLPMMEIDEDIDWVSSLFYCLNSAHATDKLHAIAPEFSEKLTLHSKKFTLDARIFKKVKALYDQRESLNLTTEELRITDKLYHDFIRNGALLGDEDKEKLKKIDQELSKTSLQFSQNTLKATKEFKLHITDKNELDGLPEDLMASAQALAKADNKEGYIFTLDYPSFVPFMKYCKNRKLRETMARANGQKATGGEFNNQQNVIDIVRLRIERAKLLGYKTHAEFVLEKRMAKKPHDVWDFLHNLLNTSKAVANKELDELKALASELDGIEEFQTWDTSFYSEILKQRKLSFDDQVLKPYFEINRVLEGMFLVAEKLYNISFAPNTTAPVYHKDVLAYDVADLKTNKSLGLFYVDLFPRETKRQGAWMMSFREQGYYKGKVRRPVVAIVCNFPTPTDDNPSLLSLNEVTTLFHEFGHALHVLLTQCQYQMLSGASVYWDFVELPSQIMENWVKEKECLDLFAKHFETGEGINSEIIHKIKESNQFLEGLQTLRQVSFALLDMNWHDLKEVPTFIDVEAFEKQAMHEARLLPENPGNIMSTSFGHLFAGGYSAGYYSYKWAEVLDADAFEYFLENGIFNREIGEKFRTCILEKGGVDDPMELYKSFRGREPKIDALMKRAGFYQ